MCIDSQAMPSLEDVAELPTELARHLLPRAAQRIAAEEARLREAGAGDRRKLLQVPPRARTAHCTSAPSRHPLGTPAPSHARSVLALHLL